MYREELNREESNHHLNLIKRFEDMVVQNKSIYFDSDDLEIILDHYHLNNQNEYIQIALNLSEKLFPFSTSLRLKKAQILISMDKLEEAKIILEKIKPLSLNNEDFDFTMSVVYSRQSKHKEAITILEKLFFKDPSNLEVISSLANEYQCINDHLSSCRMIEKLIQLEPQNDLYWYSYYLSSELIDINKRNLYFTKSILENDPYCLLAWFYLGLFYQKNDNHLKAIEAFDYAILIDEKYTRSYSHKSESLSEVGLYQQAINCCFESMKFEEPNCNTYFELGEYHKQLNKLEKALVYFYKAIRKDSTFSDAWFSISQILDDQGNHLESLYHIKQAYKEDSTNLDILFFYAEMHEKVGFIKEAEIAYKKVLEFDNKDYESWLNYTNILYQQESLNEAIDSLYEAIDYNPKNAKLIFRLSAYLLKIGDETKGTTLFENALKINYDLHKELFEYMPSIKNNKNLLNLLDNFKK